MTRSEYLPHLLQVYTLFTQFYIGIRTAEGGA